MVKLSTKLLKHIKIIIDLDARKKIVLINTFDIGHLDNPTYNSNIYCIDENDNIIWRVDSDKGNMPQDSFVYIEKTADGIYAQRFFGMRYIIDPKTGTSEETGWCK